MRGNNENGSGSFRTTGGVYVAERRLRLLLGLPLNDDRLIRPNQEPSLAKVVFDWDTVVSESLTRRPELRRQRLNVRRRELELLAHQNFLKPRLDAVGRYRYRGLGHDLIDPAGGPFLDNAYQTLASGDYQEWQLGFEFSMPLGFREGHAAVRNSQLLLAREQALLHEQERQVVHDLSNVMSDLDRAYKLAQVNLNRRRAAQQRLQVLDEKARQGNVTFVNLTLDAQQRLASADSDFFRSLADYALAVKNVHFNKDTWKTYHQIFLAEDLTRGLSDGRAVVSQGDGPVVTGGPAPVPQESTLRGLPAPPREDPPAPNPGLLGPPPGPGPAAPAGSAARTAAPSSPARRRSATARRADDAGSQRQRLRVGWTRAAQRQNVRRREEVN